MCIRDRANPALDRQLLKDAPLHSLNRLAEVRRRAYFEQPDAAVSYTHLDVYKRQALLSAQVVLYSALGGGAPGVCTDLTNETQARP